LTYIAGGETLECIEDVGRDCWRHCYPEIERMNNYDDDRGWEIAS
jgi:hypothetical protein